MQLISTDAAVPSDTLHTAVAQVESRLNLSANALLRLERAFADRFADTTGTDDFGFAQKLEASLVMVQAYRARARGAAAGQTADRMQVLRDNLGAAARAMTAKLGPADGPVPRTMEELQVAIAAMRRDGSLEDSAAVSEQAVQLMVRVQLEMAKGSARHDRRPRRAGPGDRERAGGCCRARRDRWFDEAISRARRPEVEPYLLPLALYQANRRDEAAAALREAAPGLSDDLLFSLWVRVGDLARGVRLPRSAPRGRATHGRLGLAAHRSPSCVSAEGDATAARDAARAGITAFEATVAGVLRDPDRLDACDQPDVVALYATVALAEQSLGQDSAAFDAAESVRRVVSAERASAPQQQTRGRLAASRRRVLRRVQNRSGG